MRGQNLSLRSLSWERVEMTTARILVVDDVPVVGIGLQRELSLEGYCVELAFSGKQALEIALKKSFDLILIDLIMPNMNGIEVCKALKSINRDAVLVYMTGRKDMKDKELEFVKAGGKAEGLYKPFEEGQVLEITRRILSPKGKA